MESIPQHVLSPQQFLLKFFFTCLRNQLFSLFQGAKSDQISTLGLKPQIWNFLRVLCHYIRSSCNSRGMMYSTALLSQKISGKNLVAISSYDRFNVGSPPKSHNVDSACWCGSELKSPMLVYETVRRARNIGLQHVIMCSERGMHQFTWLVDVLGTFLRRFGC